MLELLLRQYEDQFGVAFPLKDFEGTSEIELINILYDCAQNNRPYDRSMQEEGRKMPNLFPDAPGM